MDLLAVYALRMSAAMAVTLVNVLIKNGVKIVLVPSKKTVLEGKPGGFVSWNPTNLPESAEVGHNCILTEYKGNGYGKRQMQEAVQRMIAQGAKKIVVWTNEICVPAQHTYESVGFQFVKKSEETFSEYAGQRIHYEIIVS